jgi:hypothetical protein
MFRPSGPSVQPGTPLKQDTYGQESSVTSVTSLFTLQSLQVCSDPLNRPVFSLTLQTLYIIVLISMRFISKLCIYHQETNIFIISLCPIRSHVVTSLCTDGLWLKMLFILTDLQVLKCKGFLDNLSDY